jgi:cytochrome b561
MTINNTQTRYGSVTKSLHWLTALLVIGLLAVGLYMADLPNSPDKLKIYGLHKSFGITVLSLTFCRILWHIISKKPGPVETLKPWEKHLSKALHAFLYIFLVAMPLTGWLRSSAGNFPVSFFGLFALPNLVAPDKEMTEIFKELHETIGTLIMITVGLHIAAALKHHFIDKDTVLKRMLPALLMVLIASPAFAATVKWDVVPEKSSLTFRARQLGAEFKGGFDRFTADIAFDPDNLADSAVKADVDVSSVNTQATDRDENLKSKDWFDVRQFPAARFETTAFRQTSEDTYEAPASLTIKNITLPVTLLFSLDFAEGDSGKDMIATADGSVTLDRSKFNLGGGGWKDAGVIANEVLVDIHIVARREKSVP